MNLKELVDKINRFRNQTNTRQRWRKDSDFFYENEFLKVLRIDSSNKPGGKSILNGKQWSIIIDIKRPFSHLKEWNHLCEEFNEDLKITKVASGLFKGYFGIRFYRMSLNPTNEIIEDILNYLFKVECNIESS